MGKANSLQNPFFGAPDTGRVKACADTARAARFRCVVGQFRRAHFPIGIRPGQDPLHHVPSFFDSLFVLHSLEDRQFFEEGPYDRTYGYYKGLVLDRTPRYVLFLMPFGFNVGQSYRLYSCTADGKRIVYETLADSSGDYSTTFGTMPDAHHFTTRYTEFGEEEGKVSKRLTQHFVIDDGGRFVRQ